jgi:RNA polymerase sigma factor (sigma-70 family)
MPKPAPLVPLTPDLQQLVLDHQWIARTLAYHRARKFPCLSRDDLLGDAELALCNAATRFDPSLGIPFGAYAQMVVRHAVYHTVRRFICRRCRDEGQLSALSSDEGPFEPTEHRDTDPARRMMRHESALNAMALCQRIRRCVQPRSYSILHHRGQGETLEAIGERFGITRQAVRRLIAQARDLTRRTYPQLLTAFDDGMEYQR